AQAAAAERDEPRLEAQPVAERRLGAVVDVDVDDHRAEPVATVEVEPEAALLEPGEAAPLEVFEVLRVVDMRHGVDLRGADLDLDAVDHGTTGFGIQDSGFGQRPRGPGP